MTFSKQELRNTISQHSDLHPLQVEGLLSKLDAEDLESLDYILNDFYGAGEDEACGWSAKKYTESDLDISYDKGYKDGFEAAKLKYEDSGYNRGYQEGYDDGMDSGAIKNPHG